MHSYLLSHTTVPSSSLLFSLLNSGATSALDLRLLAPVASIEIETEMFAGSVSLLLVCDGDAESIEIEGVTEMGVVVGNGGELRHS